MRFLRNQWQRFRQELEFWRAIGRHPGTPRLARWLLGIALVYAVTPFDLIPDFIPVLGQLDDLIIIPLLVVLAMRLVPRSVTAECRMACPPVRSN